MGDKLYTFSFKEGFKRARKKGGYTQKSFAEEFNVSSETVKNWEQGRNVPEIETLEKLCNFFQCDVDYLLGNMECETHDIQFIHDKTGLSGSAINKLLELYNNAGSRIEIWDAESCLDIINKLLASEDFMRLIQLISNADGCEMEVHRLNSVLWDPLHKKSEVIGDIHFNIGELARYKFRIISMFHRMIQVRYKGIGEWFEQYKNDFTLYK